MAGFGVVACWIGVRDLYLLVFTLVWYIVVAGCLVCLFDCCFLGYAFNSVVCWLFVLGLLDYYIIYVSLVVICVVYFVLFAGLRGLFD